jgi:hypothetical protein
MKYKHLFFIALTLCFLNAKSQQYSLFNTRTLFDSFENPAVKAFTLDSSRKFAANFLLPNYALNAANNGSANNLIRRIFNDGVYDSNLLPLGSNGVNTLNLNSNLYLLTFKVFTSHKNNQEIGFAWQVRTDLQANYTNETLGLLQNYKHFNNQLFDGVLNNNAYLQNYHQLSISIRENLTKQLAFGLKLSALSGIAYNSVATNNSSLLIDKANNSINASLNGTYRASFMKDGDLNRSTLMPNFKNPGFAVTLGTTYQSKSGFFIMANVKDLGFINWRKTAYIANYKFSATVNDINIKDNNEITEEITNNITNTEKQQNFITPTNARADFLISKTFNFYKPSLIVSKNLFQNGGDIAFVNTLKYNSLSASITPTYNFNNFFMLGLQAMYQTPNFEFFVGTDNLTRTASMLNNINSENPTVRQGHVGASFYMGIGIKFGKKVEHPLNLSTMPGVNGQKPYKGFFRSLFNLFRR